MSREPERIEAGEARLYRIPLDLFPGLSGYAHLVLAPNFAALIDVGSGFGDSNEQLDVGLRAVGAVEGIGWTDLTHVLISHGHIDHYGGLSFVRERTKAPVGIHRLDRDVLTDYPRRLDAAAGRLRRYLQKCGVEGEEQQELMDLYLFTKQLFHAQDVDFVVRHAEERLGPLEMLHVPGHCPGQLVLRVGDLLLTSDHVLPGITPHMAPASLARHTGLGEYLDSLDRLELWGGDARLGLGGHGPPIHDVAGRIDEIRDHHEKRLQAVLKVLRQPTTIADVADRMFPSAGGYHRLLALEEVGAHVEFLDGRGLVERTVTTSGAEVFGARPGEPPVVARAAGRLS
ncbi:MAG TPA: MBL fold metallo-hydrolase [Anaerolineales bacterium]|nr:MBL fold metallo-hydrolase [Anaerolineales bacterium]